MAEWIDGFLEDLDPRPWTRPDGAPASIAPEGLFLGGGEFGLEVAVGDAGHKPRHDDVRRLWHARQGGRATPLLLVVGYQEHSETKVVLCGPVGEQPPIVATSLPQAERLAGAALAEPSRHAAVRFLAAMLPEIDTDLPGVRNVGMLANHELQLGVPQRPDWQQACDEGGRLLALCGRDLVEGLGFTVEQLGTTATVLATARSKRAVAVYLDERETFDDPATRFSGTSPVGHALALADRESLPWVVLTRQRQVRLYAARPDTGVGRKGRADTYVELNLALVPDDRAGYLPLLFGSGALDDGGTLDQILETSARFATDLAVRLRERVYFDCVPSLAESVAARLSGDAEPTEAELAFAYECTLTVLFRLLFVAYAEDKDLLPYRTNSKYADHSLKLIARRLAEDRRKDFGDYDGEAFEHWEDVKQLWRAVDKGNRSWGVPPYNGGLFSSDAATNAAGQALTRIELTDAEFAPVLSALLVDESEADGVIGPVDFRSLSVREFGTIYEGLLESKLSVATTDLTTDAKRSYMPVRSGREEVWVEAGAIYFHNRSGARKATGSYFTKPIAVEHLLDHALEPALADHIDRLAALYDAGDDAATGAAFFDFRCVDLAMGSGHFLTAAVDRIEARLSAFLALHPVGPIHAELDVLRRSAVDALGDLADGVEIETTTLLRRLVARRCVYGVDLNPMAGELARLSLWIHTFVPGLPLSFLSHSLVVGNSLTGIGTIAEALIELDPDHDPDRPSLFRNQIEALLDRASGALKRLATVTEATVSDVRAAARAQAEASAAVAPARQLFDVIVAARIGETELPEGLDEDRVGSAWNRAGAGLVARRLQALHFPVAFPEVFLRSHVGFDCVLGNPPWDKVRFEPQQFWVTRSPGLRSLSEPKQKALMNRLRLERPAEAEAEDQERLEREQLQLIADRAFRWQGRGQHGHHDFSKMFLERALTLLASGGSLGYVLPRTSLVLGGWTDLRRVLLDRHTLSTAQTRNRGGWLFDDVDQRLMMVLLCRTEGVEQVWIWPAIVSPVMLADTRTIAPMVITREDIELLTDKSVIPWFGATADRDLFDRLRSMNRFASGHGWISGTADSARWDFSTTGRHGSLASASGGPESWHVLMTRHVDQYRIAREESFQRLVRRPGSLVELGLGVIGRGRNTHIGLDHPPIIYRYPSRNDDSRTLIATAMPYRGFLPSKGYVHSVRLVSECPADDVLALLGLMNSYVCDWWVRRFVDRHVTKQVIDNLPLPQWSPATRTEVAEHVTALLASNGVDRIACRPEAGMPPSSEQADELVTAIEMLVLRGFNLHGRHLRAALDDFSDQGCPPNLRERLIRESAAVR